VNPALASPGGRRPGRVVAVDLLRGLVLFFLLPDLAGGFSFYAVAQALPDNPVWAALARQFQHVEWTGVALWDLVMPLFVFMVGVSMALSHESRRQAGQTQGQLLAQAALRSVSLFLMGLVLQFKPMSRFDELLPFLLLSTGLGVGQAWSRLFRGGKAGAQVEAVDMAYTVAIQLLVGVWMATHYRQLGHYEIGNQILALLGLAYLPAYLLQRLSLRAQAVSLVLLLVGYGLVFALHDVPVMAPRAGAEVFSGAFAHWNAGVNVAAAFDSWFFPLFPRGEPYQGNPHDYHSLLVVPMVAAILFGAIVGRWLATSGPSRELAWRLAAVALAGLALSGLMSLTVAPLLKSLWTPTWSVFSSCACLLLLAALMLLSGSAPAAGRWALPLVVLGSNSILLYVLAFTQRWRVLAFWDHLLAGLPATGLPWWPLAQSCLVLATFWLLAYLLYRAKVLVRL